MGKRVYHNSHCDMQPWARVVHLASLWDAKQITSFGWWNVTPAGWQVTLCDHIWHVSSSSGETCCILLSIPGYVT